jgi:hypothetical protein
VSGLPHEEMSEKQKFALKTIIELPGFGLVSLSRETQPRASNPAGGTALCLDSQVGWGRPREAWEKERQAPVVYPALCD